MKNKRFCPIFIDLEKKNILIIGGGSIAYRKARKILDYKARVTILTLEIKEDKIRELDINIRLENIEKLEKNFLKEYFLVIAATENKKINNEIVEYCLKNNILVNNVTSKEDMDVRMSTIISSDEYDIGISGKGNPKKALKIKSEIEEFLKVKK